MRVAILHDYLNQFGGAERVLLAMLELFPNADIYTLLYDRERTFGLFEHNIKKTSFLDVQPVRRKHRMFIPFMPFASDMMKSDEHYDLILSSTAGYAKGFHVKGTYHVSYCHSPLRYAWEVEYLSNLSFAPWAFKEIVATPIAHKLREWDIHAASHVNVFIANSNYIAEKIHAYYSREAQVIYPPVATDVFYPETTANEGDYYLMVGRLLYYKVFDVAIKAFNDLKKPLKIVGAGPEAAKLRTIARANVEFLGNVSDAELRSLYSNAKALIFPQIEDFGLVAAEAQACGLPVLSYRIGGGREIVRHKQTGLLFNEQTPEAIMNAVREFESMKFDRAFIAKEAQRFSKEQFLHSLRGTIKSLGFL